MPTQLNFRIKNKLVFIKLATSLQLIKKTNSSLQHAMQRISN